MQVTREDPGHERIATLDIETTHWDASKGEVVSIGIAVHERGVPLDELKPTIYHRAPDRDEADLIHETLDYLDTIYADYLVTFNGRDFDFPFLSERLELLGESTRTPSLHTPDTHLDLLHDDRKALADERGEKWPGLEETLAAYGEQDEPLIWDGAPLTNARFGEELGPAYLRAVEEDDMHLRQDLVPTMNDYLRDDLEKNLRLYYYDIGHLKPEN